jgi:hypothetical protein
MKAYLYKGILYTIEKTKIGYQFKAERGFDLLKQRYIDYSLTEAKKHFKELINYHFFLDDYQKQQFKNKIQ